MGINPEHISPNAIPPRTSSTGFPPSSPTGPVKSVLSPVPEGAWISSSSFSSTPTHRRMSSTGSGTAARGVTAGSSLPEPSNGLPGSSSGAVVGGGAGLAPPPGPNAALSSGHGSGLPPPDQDSAFRPGDGSRWPAEQERIVLGPYEYVTQQPGKDIRRQLIAAFDAWLKVPEDKLAVIAKVISMLHNASLLVDDVEDSSLLRRGEPVAHSVFGVAQTLNSGNYVYFLALQELLLLGNPRLVEIYTHELCNLHRGQGMDLYWRDTLTCPTEAEYLDMVGNKTGGLFRLTIKLLMAESKTDIDCLPLVDLIGLIFQIRDDYMNLWSKDYTQNKGLCEDLTEGKFSFPVIHSIRRDPSNLQLVNILRQKTTDDAVKRYAVDYMERTGSFVYTQGVVREMLGRARKMAEQIDDGRGEAKAVLTILDKFEI